MIFSRLKAQRPVLVRAALALTPEDFVKFFGAVSGCSVQSPRGKIENRMLWFLLEEVHDGVNLCFHLWSEIDVNNLQIELQKDPHMKVREDMIDRQKKKRIPARYHYCLAHTQAKKLIKIYASKR